jgi:hypothetical protein
MKAILLAAFAVATLGVAIAPASADSMSGSSMMMAPKCPATDPVVGVNTMSKMYETHDQMKMKMANMTDAQKHDAMMKNHMKLMCMSSAKAMGAKPMTPKM